MGPPFLTIGFSSYSGLYSQNPWQSGGASGVQTCPLTSCLSSATPERCLLCTHLPLVDCGGLWVTSILCAIEAIYERGIGPDSWGVSWVTSDADLGVGLGTWVNKAISSLVALFVPRLVRDFHFVVGRAKPNSGITPNAILDPSMPRSIPWRTQLPVNGIGPV